MPGDRFIFQGLLLLVLWSPIPLGSNRPWSAALLMAVIFLLAAAWSCLHALGKVEITPAFVAAKPCLLALALGVGWNAVQLIPLPAAWVGVLSPHATEVCAADLGKPGLCVPISVDAGASRVALLKGTAYLAFFGLALLTVNSRQRLKTLAYAILAGGVFQASYASFKALGGHHWTDANGTFVNRNHLAGYLEMCLAVGVGLLMTHSKAGKPPQWRARLKGVLQLLLGPKARIRLGLAVMVIALVLTRSRMGNTAFFTSLLISGGLGLALFKTAKTSTVILLASLILVDLVIVGHWFGVEKVASRIQQTTLATEERDEMDISAMPLLKDYWLAGSGAGSFYNIFCQYEHNGAMGFWDHAHNDYLEFASEFGVMGFIPLSIAVLLSLQAGVKAQLNRHASIQRGMGFGSVMGIIALLIHSSVDFNLQIPSNALLFLLLMAIAWVALSLRETPLTDAMGQ
jgi:putative inorganic carbon (HCO3(-)) transporter